MSPAEAKYLNRLVARLIQAARTEENAGSYQPGEAKMIRFEFSLAQKAYKTFVRTLTESPK